MFGSKAITYVAEMFDSINHKFWVCPPFQNQGVESVPQLWKEYFRMLGGQFKALLQMIAPN